MKVDRDVNDLSDPQAIAPAQTNVKFRNKERLVIIWELKNSNV